MYLAVSNRSTFVPSAPKATLSGEAYATCINLSGRRRFTSQRVVLYALLAAGGDLTAAGIAAEALNLFREAHAALVKGSRGVPLLMSPALHDAYFGPVDGQAKIMHFVSLAERVLHAIESGWRHQTPVLMDELVQSTTPLLATLNSITALYEAQARVHAKQMELQLLEAMNEIKSISKQAQIVALNARIVAARAGAAGREFSVVATELISITQEMETVLQSALPAAP